MQSLKNYFKTNHGTERGFVRLLLALGEHYLGTTRRFRNPDFGRVSRVVFVCLGNICRSAYGHHYALPRLETPVVSCGISTTTNVPANDVAQEVAAQRGQDLSTHRTTDFSDFEVQPGDLFLVMEIRQAKRMEKLLGDRQDVQIALLGNWARPLRPHIHDPHTLSRNYFDKCFQVIESATENLQRELDGSRSGI